MQLRQPISGMPTYSMYNTFYGLTADPFRLTPDSHVCFEHTAFLQADQSLLDAVSKLQGLLILHGLPGTGKTMLLQVLAAQLPPPTQCHLLQASGLDTTTLLQQLDISTQDNNLTHLANQLSKASTVLLIDEAQALPDSTWALLLALYQATTGSAYPLTIIMATHSATLKKWRTQQQLEHIHFKTALATLDEQTTVQYINFRLNHYGFTGESPFSPRTLHFIHRFSRGIPRRINLICSRLLMHGQLTQTRNLTLADLHQIICELNDEKLLLPSKKR